MEENRNLVLESGETLEYDNGKWDNSDGNFGMTNAANYLKSHYPSDEIVMNEEFLQELIQLRNSVTEQNKDEDVKGILDIILSDTIPLKDSIINIDNHRFRLCVFEDVMDRINNLDYNKKCVIGMLYIYERNVFQSIGIAKELNTVDGEEVCEIYPVVGADISDRDGKFAGQLLEGDMIHFYNVWLAWSGMQLALLHPKLKIIMSDGKKAKDYIREKDETTGKRKRVVKYIKRHYVSESADLIRTTREFVRHCKAWYVIGHWRHYKSGKVSYVHGYWKGELRELKRNLDEGRNREIEV